MRPKTYTHPQQSLGFLLHQSAINWRRALASELRPIDLTPVQFFMLGSTSRLTTDSQDGPTQKEVVENTGIDVNVVSQVVRQMERRGLLVRTRNQNDGRAYHVCLTPIGKEKLHAAIAKVHHIDTVFFRDSVGDKLSRELKKLV